MILPNRGALSGIGLDTLNPFVGNASDGEVVVERYMGACTDRDLLFLFVRFGFALA